MTENHKYSEYTPAHENENLLIKTEQVRLLYKNASVSMTASLINSCILVLILWDIVNHRHLILWLISIIIVTGLRYIDVLNFNHTAIEPSIAISRGRWFALGATLSGIAWGSAGVVIFPFESLVHQAFLVFVLGGMVIGAAGAYSVIKKVFFLYSIPTVSPIIIRFILYGDINHIAMAGMTLLFAALVTAMTMYMFNINVNSLRIRFENKNLISYLSSAKESAEKSAHDLSLEIERRKKTGEELNQHKQNLLTMVEDRTAELISANNQLKNEINERKQTEEALRKSEYLLKQTQQLTKVGGWEYDIDKQWISWTDEVYSIYEVPADYNPNNIAKDMEFYAPLDRQVISRAFWDAVEKGTPYDLELQLITAKGRPKWVRTTARVERLADKTVRVFGNIMDITEDRKLEEEVIKSRKLESVGILAGGIAHDFNNLLQAILGNVSLAKMYLAAHSPERVSSLLERAEETLETAKELSFRLLTFSKGGEPIRNASSVENILRKSIALSLSGSNVTCDISPPHDLYPIEIDEGQMIQVFNNILINAKEATPNGGSISVTAKNVTISENDSMPLKEGDYVQISIKDNGIGIPEEVLPKIFDPYFSTKEIGAHKGSGLGLSICFSIVRKHEGHISVESGKGKGTSFHVFLPALINAHHAQETAMEQPQYVSTRRLLFMDDDADIRRLIEEIMDYLGHDAEYARNGEEAVEIFRRAKESGIAFDLVVLDLTVKEGMGGDKAIKKMLEIDPEVKAVISSGYVDAPIIKDYQKYGFVDAIVKPYKIEQLKELIDKLNLDT